MAIQTFNQNSIVVELSNLAPSTKKSVIHVLHVDDDPSLQEITKLMLLDLNSSLEIDNACCVDEAFKKLAAKDYDVVVSDYEMPQKDGLQFLKELREQNNEIPFILFTGKGREEVSIKALNLGADGYFHKQGPPETVYGELVHGITQATGRAKAKSALEESEKRYRTIMEQAADSIFIHDKNRRIIDANEAANRKLGYTREELLSMSITDISSNATEDAMEDLWPKIIAGQTITMEANHKTKSGNIFPVEVTLGPLTIDKETQIVGLVRDITERKNAETLMKETKEQLELQIKRMPFANIVLDKDFKVVSWNPAAEKIFGYSAKEAIGKHPYDTIVPKEAQPVVEKIWQRLLEGDETAHSINDNLTKDGKKITCSWYNTPLKREDNSVIGVLSMVQDITERKKAEEALNGVMDQLVLVNEKLGVVGSLTRHDVRNKLSTVTGYAYLLKKKHADQADIVEGLGKMEQAVKETVRIFEFAKMYEQIGAEELTSIDVEAKLNEAATLFSGSLPKIINECHGLTLLADSFLRQLFYNFIDNTRKYGQKTTTIKVTYEKTNQDSLKLIYEDDGVGIPLENKHGLFKEGFSTGGSTGFGLFLTKKMIDVYGWTIEENGEPSKGAKFTITIPKLNKNGKENYRIVP